MQTELLNFDYPEELVAVKPAEQSRILWSAPNSVPVELTKKELFSKLNPNDIVIINDTKVEKRRVTALDGSEILFVEPKGMQDWLVLFPAKNYSVGDEIELPSGLKLTLKVKGIPQQVTLNQPLTPEYFSEHGVVALPPYIQKRRKQIADDYSGDDEWYQTDWAEETGSCAAPTASLHFSRSDWQQLQAKGISVTQITLHVGIGTFLPVTTEKLQDHKMHKEQVYISRDTLKQISECKARGGRVWALGTTVTRALESWAAGILEETDEGAHGETELFIQPGFRYQVVDVLMTNFHQPKSTLLALVGAFAGVFRTKEVYEWAILNRFRLFSYGDLSVWLPE